MPTRSANRTVKAKSSVPRALNWKSKRKVNPRLKLSRPLKTLVNKEINKGELVCSKVYNYPRTSFNNVPSAAADVIRLMPDIAQAGTGSTTVSRENRQGSKLRLTSLSIQGTVDIPPPANSNDPDRASLQCRLLCLSCKKYGDLKDVIANWTSGSSPLEPYLLRDGEAGIPYPGHSWGNRYPINTNLFTVHKDIRFNLTRGVQVIQGSGDGTTLIPYPIKHFKFNVKCKNKILKYRDSTGIQATNFAPFCLFMYSFQNGAAPSVLAAIPYVELTAQARWKSMA